MNAPSPTPSKPADRWPALDGLRGLMTMGVFAAHVNYPWLPGSVLFMDMFFMMSSFFITRLLVKDWRKNGRIDFAAFYMRRVRRLFPALLLVVAAVMAYAFLQQGKGWADMLHVAGALFYFSNWLRALGIPHGPFLGHTWSLSIEEQFYVVWPVLLALSLWVYARSRPKHGDFQTAAPLGVGLLVGVVLSTFAWRAYLTHSGASIERLYNGTDMRLDSLALGALLALTLDAPRVRNWCATLARPWVVWLLMLGLLGGALSVGYFDRPLYLWQQSAFSLLSLLLLMSFIPDPTGLGLKWVLQNPVSLYLGSICYGVYLWHSPLIEIGRNVFGLTVWQNLAICAPVTLTLAALSYRFVELPALKGRLGSAR